ncbi:uncharacterized protein LOC119161833 [Rhipicephalus microplus]|uniref:uncharacterized protein LOC119161833 n=1 Tax=Rhipicephalus microplus TaxID=6941 RepID=UPI003F6CAD80
MARNASKATVRLTLNQSVSDLVNQLRFPEAVIELVLNNCIANEPAQLCKQISRCPLLRILRCCANVLQPSQLLQLTLEQLPRLERLELSLVNDAAFDSEIRHVRGYTSQSSDIISCHGLREMYVEVGGHRNFEVLQELLKFYPELTDLHVHYVWGDLWNAVSRCQCIVEKHHNQLKTFTLTSELTASPPTLDGPIYSRADGIYAAICDNFRYQTSSSCTTTFKLDELMSTDRTTILPSQLSVLATYSGRMVESFRFAITRNVWEHVRQLSILLLPRDPCVEFHAMVRHEFREDIARFFHVVLQYVAELNLNSLHFALDFDFIGLLGDRLHSLHALSVPPCAFPNQSAVRHLAASCHRLRDLDVRLEKRRGHFRCHSCELLQKQGNAQPPSYPATLSSSSSSQKSAITGLTLCGVPSNVLLWFVDCYRDAVKLRLAEWFFVKSLQFNHLCRLLGKNGIRCLVLKHQHLPITYEYLQASLASMTSLQHLCLLTSMQVSDIDATKCCLEIAVRATKLQYVHMHYKHDADGSEQRLTWLRRRRKFELLRDRPCLGCCSTATFIGLVKPLNRDCDAGL